MAHSGFLGLSPAHESRVGKEGSNPPALLLCCISQGLLRDREMSACLELGLARRGSVPGQAVFQGVLQLLFPPRVPWESKAEHMKPWDRAQKQEKRKNKGRTFLFTPAGFFF